MQWEWCPTDRTFAWPGGDGPVAQVSQPAVPPISESARGGQDRRVGTSCGAQVWKPAIQQTGTSAVRGSGAEEARPQSAGSAIDRGETHEVFTFLRSEDGFCERCPVPRVWAFTTQSALPPNCRFFLRNIQQGARVLAAMTQGELRSPCPGSARPRTKSGTRATIAVIALTTFNSWGLSGETSTNLVPSIRANSISVLVEDGATSERGVLVPSAKPDRYQYRRSKEPRNITFTTDIESISFRVKESEVHDFVVLLKKTQQCLLRIEPRRPLQAQINRIGPPPSTATHFLVAIPLSTRLNNKPYIPARINDGPELRFLLDIGTTGSGIATQSASRSGVRFGGSAIMGAVEGTESIGMSSGNTVHIGSLTWTNVPLFEHKGGNTFPGEHGIIGNSVLEDQVIEINYTESVFRIHPSMPDLPVGYSKLPMRMIHAVPHIPVEFIESDRSFTHWMMFDTGYENAILLNHRTASEHRMYQAGSRLGNRVGRQNGKTGIVGFPRLKFGNHIITNVPVDLQLPGVNPYPVELLGNDLLKRFDCFIDYNDEAIYLRPNLHFDAPYDRARRLGRFVLGAAISAATAGMVIVIVGYRRKSRVLGAKRAGRPNLI
jgi:Aspartyl protease